ncbi:hypothetical protein DKX15_14865 [Enterococcus faecium]|nr:hypothetical protein DKX15_14865 [Enterococcus faecium]
MPRGLVRHGRPFIMGPEWSQQGSAYALVGVTSKLLGTQPIRDVSAEMADLDEQPLTPTRRYQSAVWIFCEPDAHFRIHARADAAPVGLRHKPFRIAE